MEKTDKKFMFLLCVLVVGIVGLSVVVFIAANLVGDQDYGKSEAQIALAKERLAPIGQVNVAGAAVAADNLVSVQAAPRSGVEVYNSICMACHDAGIAGAPKRGDKAAWAARLSQGKEVLYQHALNGKGAMPAKGGNPALSDAEVKAAVDYLIK